MGSSMDALRDAGMDGGEPVGNRSGTAQCESCEAMVATEDAVGVRRFAAPEQAGFEGIIKHRWNDFHVNEIRHGNGEVLRLTDLTTMPGEDKEPRQAAEQQQQQQQQQDDGQVAAVGKVEIKEDMQEEQQRQQRLEQGLAALQKALEPHVQDAASKVKGIRALLEDGGADVVTMDAMQDKAARGALHQLVREHFGKVLDSDTVEGAVRVGLKASNKIGNKRGRDGKSGGGGGDRGSKRLKKLQGKMQHLWFLLYKENMDTQHWMSLMSKRLHIKTNAFHICGTKDKRGVTVQQVTVQGLPAERLRETVDRMKNINRRDRGRFFEVGNFRYVREPARLGWLGGNAFKTCVRDVFLRRQDGARVVPGTHSDEARAALEQIERAIKTWHAGGFLNYFGMQRFGDYAVATHEIGRLALRGQFRQACKALLDPETTGVESHRDAAREALADFAAGKGEKAVRKMPNALSAMRQVLATLVRRGAKSDLDAVSDGDLAEAFMSINLNLRNLYVHGYQSYIFNLLVTKRVDLYGCDRVVEGDLVCRGGVDAPRERDVEVAKQADIDAGKWDVRHIVLPLVGTQTAKWPTHKLDKAWCAQLMAEDGVNLAEPSSPYVAQLAPKGAYRRFLLKPTDVSHEWIYYDGADTDVCLAQTDMDRILGQDPRPNPALASSPSTCAALVLSFRLDSATYATMAFRELLKIKTDHTQRQVHTAPKTAAAADP